MDYMVKMKNYNSPPPLDGISSELKQLLTSLLNPDVALRPTLKGILTSQWIKHFGFSFQEAGFSETSPLQNSSNNTNINWTSPSFLHDNDVIDYLVTLIDDKLFCQNSEPAAVSSTTSAIRRDAEEWQQALMRPVLRIRRCLRSQSVSCRVELPHQERIWFKSSNVCQFCFLRCLLYVEKGQAVISYGWWRKKVEVIDLTTAYLVEHAECPSL